MRVFHMKPTTKRRLLWSNRPSFDEHVKAFMDAFLNGGYTEVGQFPGTDRGDARAAIPGARAIERGDIITVGNTVWKVEPSGESYLGTW